MQQLNASVHRRHYLLIALTGLAGFILVLSMRFSLKNDILVFDYPIKYHINNSLQQGASPLWFNYWAKGFPFDTMLTWSAFSPAQMITVLIGPYSLYTLHLEFLIYVLLCGFGFYRLLTTRLRIEPTPALLLSLSYMLSGFVVGSSQWLGYITCAAFFPFLLAQFISLMRQPAFGPALLSAALAYLMFTSTYVPLSIVCCYLLAAGFLYSLVRRFRKGLRLLPLLGYSALSISILLLLLWPLLHQTLELLPWLDRGQPISGNKAFFNSNYLHPAALASCLFPLQSVKLRFPGTEGAMMHLYLGLWPLILLPALIRHVLKKGTGWKAAALLLFLAAFFLLSSMGNLLPFRSALNILPGFSYFRHPGILRFFFILFFLLSLALAFPTKKQLDDFLKGRLFTLTLGTLFLAILLTAVLVFRQTHLDWHAGFRALMNELSPSQGVLISAALQLAALCGFMLSRRSFAALIFICMADMTLNTLICTPFFTVSSYSVADVMRKLPRDPNYPVQIEPINSVPTQVREGNAVWFNSHCFIKKISTRRSYYGPLDLRIAANQDSLRSVLPLHADGATLHMTTMRPGLFEATINTLRPATVILEQNYLPGWEAYWNNEPVTIKKGPDQIQLTVTGSGNLRIAYRPQAMRTVILIQSAFWLLLLAGLLLKRRPRRAYVL